MGVVKIIVIGVIFISLLVVIHEFGHYSTARLFKVRVSEFMIGLPGPSVTLFQAGGTRFGLTALPFGGYARIAGMDTTEKDPLLAPALAYVFRQGTTDAQHLSAYLVSRGLLDDPTRSLLDEQYEGRSEGEQSEEETSPYARAEDLLFELESWACIEKVDTPEERAERKRARKEGRERPDRYRSIGDKKAGIEPGQPRDVADEQALYEEMHRGTYDALPFGKRLVVLFAGPLMNLITALIALLLVLCVAGYDVASPTLSNVVDGGPAQQAGIEAGDTLTSIDGVAIEQWSDLSVVLSQKSPGDTVEISWTHDGQPQTAQVTLADNNGAAQLGVYAGAVHTRMSIGEAFTTSMTYIGQVALAIINLFNPFQAQEVLSQSSSVVGVAVVATEAAEQGATSFAVIFAAVSVSLGLMNLLPIPPLDGGKILIEIISAIRRKQVSLRVQAYLSTCGILLFGGLFLYTLVQDIARIATGG